MWNFILRLFATKAVKKIVANEIKAKSHIVLNTMADKIVESEYNPVSVDTIGDIRKKADEAIDIMFEEWD